MKSRHVNFSTLVTGCKFMLGALIASLRIVWLPPPPPKKNQGTDRANKKKIIFVAGSLPGPAETWDNQTQIIWQTTKQTKTFNSWQTGWFDGESSPKNQLFCVEVRAWVDKEKHTRQVILFKNRRRFFCTIYTHCRQFIYHRVWLVYWYFTYNITCSPTC